MKRITLWLFAVAVVSGVLTAAAPSSGRAERGEATPPRKEVPVANLYASVADEPPPTLSVDPPDPKGLAHGVVWIQYRVENLRIVPVFGREAADVSPRVGHLHVHVDDLGWWWADPSNTGTVDIAGMPPGLHKVRIELVDPNHQPFPGESRTLKYTVPGTTGVRAGASDAAAAVDAGRLPAGYRDWCLISVAREEGSLDDIRAVLGNDTAINAYR